MRRTFLLLTPSRRMVLGLFAALLAFSAAALLFFAASLAKAPLASAQTSADPDEPTFAVRCNFSHRNNDDPIVYPGQKGAAHSHDFFGNRSTNAYSTYDSLAGAVDRKGNPNTTCTRPEDTAAYWMPTLSWNGKAVKAVQGTFYYRASNKDPKSIQSIPADLRLVPNTHATWRCDNGNGVPQGPYTATPPTKCSSGYLGVRVIFPECLATNIPPSDGHPYGQDPKLDSTDHRSHAAYARPNDQGVAVCPSTHPYPIPALSFIVRFPIGTSSGTVSLSSDHAGDKPGSTMHADFLNSWKQETLDHLVQHCINDFTTPEARPRPEECKPGQL